jgi:hypothetical protein
LDFMSRVAVIIVTAVGSWLVGMLGSFLVCNFIYSIGAGVVDDATYGRMHGEVVSGGGFAGAGLAVWVGLVLRRPAVGFSCVAHVVSTVAGFIGGSVDWKVGLWCYFGGLGVFALLAVFLRKRRRQRGGSGRVMDAAEGGWGDHGDDGGGWFGGDSGSDGGGGDGGGD